MGWGWKVSSPGLASCQDDRLGSWHWPVAKRKINAQIVQENGGRRRRCGAVLQHILLSEAALLPGASSTCLGGCAAGGGGQNCGGGSACCPSPSSKPASRAAGITTAVCWELCAVCVTQRGPRALFSGLTATLLRDAPFSGIYVMFYTQSKKTLPPEISSSLYAPLGNFSCGVLAGVLASLVTQPADVVKTHIQVSPHQHTRTRDAVRFIYTEYGVSGFFRGAVPRSLYALCRESWRIAGKASYALFSVPSNCMGYYSSINAKKMRAVLMFASATRGATFWSVHSWYQSDPGCLEEALPPDHH
ncbi:hypothetical protein SKAU_G00294770 [Synaphobranchus kaupii]|uniref:Uncharacterized protein n=1 Tax=Synaphobranchus kaupii TaxID=118154 RepID=A0A9Q1IMG2_SYNKA|nr:hypothetical protein SKAU_G00294770 [Synaphobranchus kaupii]